MNIKCSICKRDYHLTMKNTFLVVQGQKKAGKCLDCSKNLEWQRQFEYKQNCNTSYSNLMLGRTNIDIWDSNILRFIYEFCELNMRIKKMENSQYHSEHGILFRINVNEGNPISGFPISFEDNYIEMLDDLYSPDIDYGLHRMGESKKTIPLYKILSIHTFYDYDDVYVPDIIEPIIGYKAVTEEKGVLTTHKYIYELGIPYEETQRNMYITDFQDCYSHFCKNIEDVIFCSGKTDYLNSQKSYHLHPNILIRLFEVKAEKHCYQLTDYGWVSNKVTLLREISKDEIIHYYNNNTAIKEKVEKHLDLSKTFWDEYDRSIVPLYKNYYENLNQIYELQIKRCYKYASDICKQMNKINIDICKVCNISAQLFKIDDPNQKYLILRYKIMNGIDIEHDKDYIDLKVKKYMNVVDAIDRMRKRGYIDIGINSQS